MIELAPHLLELIRLTATSLPDDVECKMIEALLNEKPGSAAHAALESILENVRIARETSTPICQDTGTPIFYVSHPAATPQRELTAQIRTAVAEATHKNYLRPNAVDGLTGKNSGDNLGDTYFPEFHFTETESDTLTIDLILKGGGCENVGRQYALPDESLHAERNLEGVRRAALDAVLQAQGMGCAPGFLGIAIGGDRGTSYLASKTVFIENLHSRHPDPEVAAMEDRITNEANQLKIGPMGFGGNTTILNTRITSLHRLPASYFVSVSYMCWAFRHRQMTVTGKSVRFD